jgi:hypothetical protein
MGSVVDQHLFQADLGLDSDSTSFDADPDPDPDPTQVLHMLENLKFFNLLFTVVPFTLSYLSLQRHKRHGHNF